MTETNANNKTTKKCLRCGGGLSFSPKHQALFCSQCGTAYDIEKNRDIVKHDLNQVQDISESNKAFAENNRVFNCENCGGKIVLNKLEYTKKCPYCGSQHIKKTRINPGISPDGIIPFKISEKEASENFKQLMKKKFFAPNAFKNKPIADKIDGMYIPTFSYDAHSETSYVGVIQEEETIVSNGRSNVIQTRRSFSGKISFLHQNVLVEDSQNLNQLNFDKIKPFNYNELYKYDDDFIRGYMVEYHEHPVATCTDVAHIIMKNDIERAIRNKVDGNIVSLTTTVKYDNEKFAYYLLPTYKIEFMFKGKKYKSFVNGQTGKATGKAPVSKIKVTFFTIFLVFLIGGLTALFYCLFFTL